MKTLSRSEAARANGSKSRGPLTPQGKANSSRNPMRHGLVSSLSITVLPGENAGQFQLLLADIVDEHQPRTPTEMKIVEAMAVAKWRQMRAWEMSDACLRQEILDQDAKQPAVAGRCPAARAFAAFREVADSGRSLVMMNRYEARYERLYERSLKLLLRLRASDRTGPRDIDISERTQEVADSKEPVPNTKEINGETLLPDASGQRPSPAPPGGALIETIPAARRTADPSASQSQPGVDSGPGAVDY